MAERQYCHTCKNFSPWRSASKPMPENYNPCDHELRLAFKEPENPIDTDWGFYRKNCFDREPIEEVSAAYNNQDTTP